MSYHCVVCESFRRHVEEGKMSFGLRVSLYAYCPGLLIVVSFGAVIERGWGFVTFVRQALGLCWSLAESQRARRV